MPLIPNPTYAPAVVTSIKLVHDAGTDVIVSELPPGWAERHLALRRNASEERRDSEECELALTRDVSEEREHSEERGSLSPDLRDGPQSPKDPRPPAPARSEPKEYVFSKRKIYNTQFTKFWIVRHGEPLQSPPPEADASKCSGPTVFVNVPPEGESQIWLWSVDRQMWDAVSVKHVVDLDVRRQLNLNPKHVPVFVIPRTSRGGGKEGSPRFIRYIAPSS